MLTWHKINYSYNTKYIAELGENLSKEIFLLYSTQCWQCAKGFVLQCIHFAVAKYSLTPYILRVIPNSVPMFLLTLVLR